jgi:DNA-binding transcriptional LysR family regulator
MDRLDAMEILVAAVEAGSLSAASRGLAVPLATVSRKISDLEAHLNTRLLTRSRTRLTPTEAGAAYIASARRILEQVGEAERAAAGEFSTPRGELAITAPIVFGRLHLLPVVSEFLTAYPEIDVRLSLSDRNAHLADDPFDLALRIGALPDSSLIAIRLGELRRVVCASPEWLKTNGTPKKPADLAGKDAITFGGRWTFGRGETIAVHERLVVNTAEAAVDAAIAGLGVTRVLSYQAAPAVAAKTLRVVLTEFEPERLPVHLLRAEQGLLPAKTRAFIDFAVPRLKKVLP